MPSTYTHNLGIEKPATGEQAGVWGTTANNSYDTLDMAIDGYLVVAMSASTYQLATNQGGSPANGVNKLIQWTGAQTQSGTVQITPNTAQKNYIMQNKTTGGYPLVFTQGSGQSFALQQGYTAVIATDGLGSSASVFAALDSPQFSNVLVTGGLTINGAVTCVSAQTFAQSVTFNGAIVLNGPATAQNLTINTPGYTARNWDIYYRSGSGPLAPLALGSPGQFLTVLSGPALGWGVPASLSVGSSIGASTPNAIYFASAGNVLAQDGAVLINSSIGIGIGVLPTRTLHLGYARTAEMWLDTNNPGAQHRQVVWATNNTPRWALFSPPAAEPGSDGASNLGLVAYNDPANATRWVFYMTRASGNVTIGPPGGDQGGRLVVTGDNAGQVVMAVRGAPSQSTVLQVWTNSAGANLAWVDANGVVNASGLAIPGNATIGGDATIGGTLTCGNLTLTGTLGISGNLNVGGNIYAAQIAASGVYSIGTQTGTQNHGLSVGVQYTRAGGGTGALVFMGGILIGSE